MLIDLIACMGGYSDGSALGRLSTSIRCLSSLTISPHPLIAAVRSPSDLSTIARSEINSFRSSSALRSAHQIMSQQSVWQLLDAIMASLLDFSSITQVACWISANSTHETTGFTHSPTSLPIFCSFSLLKVVSLFIDVDCLHSA